MSIVNPSCSNSLLQQLLHVLQMELQQFQIYSAVLTYTSTPAGLSVGAGGVVTGFTCGTPYTITATNASTCFVTSASFTVQCQLLTPAVPTVATAVATCAANGTATVSNYSAVLTYTSTPAGLSVGAGGVVTGFTCGTPYTITATNASTCFATSASFTVQCLLLTPAVPTVATGSCYMCCKMELQQFQITQQC